MLDILNKTMFFLERQFVWVYLKETKTVTWGYHKNDRH